MRSSAPHSCLNCGKPARRAPADKDGFAGRRYLTCSPECRSAMLSRNGTDILSDRGIAAHWTQQRIIDALKAFAQKHGRAPTVSEWRRSGRSKAQRSDARFFIDGTVNENRPTVQTVRNAFGSWAAGLRAAGLERNHAYPPGLTQSERMWARIDQREPDECWPWTGGLDSYGYAKTNIKTEAGWRSRHVHRLVYAETHGTIPERLVVRRTCGSKVCCNPAHLLLARSDHPRRTLAGASAVTPAVPLLLV